MAILIRKEKVRQQTSVDDQPDLVLAPAGERASPVRLGLRQLRDQGALHDGVLRAGQLGTQNAQKGCGSVV